MTLDYSDASKLMTRDGRDVRVYATDGGGNRSIHGAVFCHSGWVSESWYANGRVACELECKGDLIPRPAPPRTGECWLNVYGDKETLWFSPHETKALADIHAERVQRVGRIKVQLAERFDD